MNASIPLHTDTYSQSSCRLTTLPGLPAADTGRTRKTSESGSVTGLEKSPICVVDEKFLLRPHVLACDDTVVSFKGFYCGNRELVSSFFPFSGV